MKYSIFYLLEGKAKSYNQKLINNIGPKYGEDYFAKLNLPPHITIKSSFKTSKEKLLEKLLTDFVKKQKQARLRINGFGNFQRFVAFLKVSFSKKAKKVQEDLYKDLKKNKIANPKNYDLEFKPHVTIAYGNNKDTFKLIWHELKKLKKPVFNLKLNNITLMKKERKHWKIHKEFKIK